MKMSIVILVVVGLALLALDNVNASRPRVPALFSFGDSVADPGNDNYLPSPVALANFPPYGETYFHKPTGRFCNGRLWIDFVDLGLPLLKPYMEPGNKNYSQGINFASAGSGLLSSTRPEHVISFPEQLEQFKKVKAVLEAEKGNKATKTILRESLYVINSGTNDVLVYLSNTSLLQSVTPLARNLQIVAAVEKSVTLPLRSSDAETLTIDVDSKICIRRAPGKSSMEAYLHLAAFQVCEQLHQMAATMFNSFLLGAHARLTKALPGLHLIITHQYQELYEMINNGTHGFTKGSHACRAAARVGSLCKPCTYNSEVQCGVKDAHGNKLYNLCPDSELHNYVFWDQFHPSQKTYRILSESWLTGDSSCSYPFNIHSLVDITSAEKSSDLEP